ncbi:protein kinase family protein / C-type lectin domain-containing protein [Wolffia australiana]
MAAIAAVLFALFVLFVSAILPSDAVASFNASSSGTICPGGWKVGPSKNKCFVLMTSSLPWTDSEEICKNHGGQLVALESSEELSLAEALCPADGGGCWIGGQGRNSTSGFSWIWSDGLTQWNQSILPAIEPSQANETASCALLSGWRKNKNTTIVSENCNTPHSSICGALLSQLSSVQLSQCRRYHCHREYLIILAVVSGLILAAATAVVLWLLLYKQSRRRRRSRKLSSPAAVALVPPSWKVFAIEELRSMTKNFSEGNRLVGDAKTGGTFVGLLPDGSRVAVKQLRKSRLQRKKEFFSEVGRLAKLHHPNLVVLKGCCYDHGDRYLIFQFISNGPLHRWLHHLPKGGKSLSWAVRMKIATTLAQAIAFLHDKVKPQVVHRDIRASNVLLDEEFGAHLMGLGLAKFVYWEVMHERTKVAGSSGYLAPEFVYQNELTTKSDVFSFGVLLLEMVTGRRLAQAEEPVGGPSILHWATPLVQAHRHMDLLDPLITDLPDPATVQKVIDLVYACTQIVPSVRPRMSHVVHQLQQLCPASPPLEVASPPFPLLISS